MPWEWPLKSSIKWLSLFLLLSVFGVGQCSDGVKYSVEINGIKSMKMLDSISEHSQLFVLQDHLPSSEASLQFRASTDIATIVKILHNYGYYDASASISLQKSNFSTVVSIDVALGNLYTFSNIAIPLDDAILDDIEIKQGTPAKADAIINAKKIILEELKNRGHPFASITSDIVLVDRSRKTVEIEILVDEGPQTLFGIITTKGLKKVQQNVIDSNIAWEEGELYDKRKIEQTKKNLENTELFSLVAINIDHELDERGAIPLEITIAERMHRSISASIGYSTNQRTNVNFQWTHRNVRGIGDQFSSIIDATEKKQRGTLLYRKPHYLCHNQDLLWSLTAQQESSESFKAHTISLQGLIERTINKQITSSFGGGIKQVKTMKSDDNASYVLINTPYRIKWDLTDSLLSPTSGTYLCYAITPYVNILDARRTFVSQNLSGSWHHPLTNSKFIVLAFSASFESIAGQPLKDIPAPYRLYGGSAQLLRGYKYQTVSPLNEITGKPTGGRALMDYIAEVRIKATEHLGFTTFYDIGNVFASTVPQFNKKLLRSWGLGLRYDTPIGPFRLDIAFPIDRRHNLDHSFHVYLSVGQGF